MGIQADIKLSILILTLPSRIKRLLKLLPGLLTQAKGKQVEILYFGDNKKRWVGKKRHDMLMLAKGEYVSFIDDDDSVADDYVDEILKALESNPDCVLFDVMTTIHKEPPKVAKFVKYCAANLDKGDHFERLPNHLMVMKRTIALEIGYAHVSRGEDTDFSLRVHVHLKKQVRIDKVLYYYNYGEWSEIGGD